MRLFYYNDSLNIMNKKVRSIFAKFDRTSQHIQVSSKLYAITMFAIATPTKQAVVTPMRPGIIKLWLK